MILPTFAPTMKIPFKAIAALIILSLTGVFAYQAYWLAGLYSSMQKDMENCLVEALQLSDYNELMTRCESKNIGGEINVGLKKGESDSIISKSNITSLSRTYGLQISEPAAVTVDKNGTLELLTRYIQRGIHSQLDLFTEVNLQTYDSLFTQMLAQRGIVNLPHRIERVNLREDSTVVQGLSAPLGYMPGEASLSFYYNYDLYNKMAYRLWVEPTHVVVLRQMQGILATSLLIILILSISFGFLIRTILRQKTLEEMKEDFTHNITHELKTPIAVAYAAGDALLNFNGVEQAEKRKNYLQIIQTQLKQLGGLVEQILSMSMEQRKNFRLSYEDILLLPMLETLTEQHRLKADKSVAFHLDVDETLTVRADRTHLYNMVSNLIDNAIKYSDGEADIRLLAWADGKMKNLSVADKGIGISRDKQVHLFDKFYRIPTGNLHNVKGYGLGLYYVKTMIEQHGGSVSVSSTQGQGSVFTLHFPA